MIKKREDELSPEEYQLKKQCAKIKKEFEYLDKTKDVVAEFTLAQAKEICAYLFRLKLTPFFGWFSHIQDNIEKDKDNFLHGYYLIENEFGILEPDMERINKLRIKQ